MPFVWNENIAVGTKLTPAQLSEIKNKTDTTTSTIGISSWSWSSNVLNNIATGKIIDDSLYTEMRQAIDYAYDNRTCASHYVSNCPNNSVATNSSYKSTVYSTNRASENTSVCGGHNGSVNGTHRSSENATVYSSNNYAAKSGHNTYVSGSNSTVNSSNRSPYNSTNRTSVNGTYRSSVNSSYKSSDITLKEIYSNISNNWNILEEASGINDIRSVSILIELIKAQQLKIDHLKDIINLEVK